MRFALVPHWHPVNNLIANPFLLPKWRRETSRVVSLARRIAAIALSINQATGYRFPAVHRIARDDP
jgi:hypothetical protein